MLKLAQCRGTDERTFQSHNIALISCQVAQAGFKDAVVLTAHQPWLQAVGDHMHDKAAMSLHRPVSLMKARNHVEITVGSS